MRALVFFGPRQLEVVEVPEPTLSAGEALLEVDAAGICGSDLHAFSGETSRRQPGIIMGHEVTGRVISIAGEAEGFEAGETVTFNPVVGCGSCGPCVRGTPNLCAARAIVGVHRHGAFAERVVVPTRNLRIAPGDRTSGVLVEPLAVGMHAVSRAEVEPGARVLVVGAGMIGLACVWAARAAGAEVVVADVVTSRLEVGELLGATTVDVSKVDLSAALERPVERVVDAVGSARSLSSILGCVESGAIVSIVGLGEHQVALELAELVGHELELRGSYCYTDDEFARTAALVADGEVEVASFIGDEVKLADAPEAFASLADGSRTGVKILVRPAA